MTKNGGATVISTNAKTISKPIMLYLGIDLHLKQMTVSLRNQGGDALLRRQVSTRWPKLEEFRKQLHQVAATEKYVAVVEVCGFHDWLVQWLRQDEYCDP